MLKLISALNWIMLPLSIIASLLALFQVSIMAGLLLFSLIAITHYIIEWAAKTIMKLTTTQSEETIYLLTGGTVPSFKDSIILGVLGLLNFVLKIVFIYVLYINRIM